MSGVIEVSNVKPIGKNSLLASCTVRIVPWKLTLTEVNVFQKGNQRWVGMPARKVESKDGGEPRYFEQMQWDNNEVAQRFRNQVVEAVDAWLIANPEMKPEPVVTAEDEVPF